MKFTLPFIGNSPSSTPLTKPSVLFLFLVLVILLLSQFKAAAGGIAFSQYRITLDDDKRYASLLVMNDDNQDSRCNIGFSHQQVQPNGDTKAVKTSKEVRNSADSIVRFSPKRVNVKANATQTVRLSLKRKKNLVKGEYVTYLKLSCRTVLKDRPATGNLVTSQIHYNIPVIARVGELQATASLSNPSVNAQNKLLVTLHRQGNRSLYGKITVTDTATNKVIGKHNGMTVFFPAEQRHIKLKLTEKPQGPLQVVFNEIKQHGGEQKASLTFDI